VRILIVEDNQEVARQIKGSLEQELFIVEVAHDGDQGWFPGDTEPYDAVILDIGLPRMDGLSVLKKWRAASNHVPVLILTSRDTWREKATGLRAGAASSLSQYIAPVSGKSATFGYTLPPRSDDVWLFRIGFRVRPVVQVYVSADDL